MPQTEKYDRGRVVAYRELVPRDVLKAAQTDIDKQSSRKRVHLLRSPQVPESIRNLGRIVAARFSVQPNAAISKRYMHTDTYISRAYNMHIDPPEWHTQDLITCSVGGVAILSLLDQEGAIQQLRLEPNTVVRMHPEVQHMVSPPLDDNARQVIFFGRSTVLR